MRQPRANVGQKPKPQDTAEKRQPKRNEKKGGPGEKFSSNSEGKFNQRYCCRGCFCSPGSLSISRSRFKICRYTNKSQTGQTIYISNQWSMGWDRSNHPRQTYVKPKPSGSLKSVLPGGFEIWQMLWFTFHKRLLESFPNGKLTNCRGDCKYNGQVSGLWHLSHY